MVGWPTGHYVTYFICDLLGSFSLQNPINVYIVCIRYFLHFKFGARWVVWKFLSLFISQGNKLVILYSWNQTLTKPIKPNQKFDCLPNTIQYHGSWLERKKEKTREIVQFSKLLLQTFGVAAAASTYEVLSYIPMCLPVLKSHIFRF